MQRPPADLFPTLKFSDDEKALIGYATPPGAAVGSARGAVLDALGAGGYAHAEVPDELRETADALALQFWTEQVPLVRSLQTKERVAAQARAKAMLENLRTGQWEPAAPGTPALAARQGAGSHFQHAEPNQIQMKTPQAPGSPVILLNESPSSIMAGYSRVIAKNAAIPLNHATYKEKSRLAREAAAIYAKDIRDNQEIASMPMEDAIKAADYSDPTGNVGLLSGTLAIQRALDLFQYEYPILSQISDDFSDAPGLLNQTETTRIIIKPAVQTRSTGVDSAGRPLGWNTVSAAQTVDVPVTLSAHVGVPIVFGQNILGSTIRNLFAEQAPQALYALGGYAVNMLTALMTPANFNAYSGSTVGTGVTTSGSTTITCASTATMFPGQQISGTGIPTGTVVASITNGTTAVLTQAATATGSALTFTLNNGQVPTTYATYIKALPSFAMASLSDIKSAFDALEVPMRNRFALLNASYYGKLAQDSSFNTFWAAMQAPDVIGKGNLPTLQGITPINAPYFPTSSNRTGFAGHKSSLILKSRLPSDMLQATDGHAPGSVTTVTGPGGLSVMLVQYVSLREGYAEWRPEVLLGAAVGDRRGGLVITSA